MAALTHLRFLSSGAYRAKRGQDYPPHSHTCWELVFYREGRIEVPIGEEIFLTRPGLLLLTPPHTIHSERALTAYSNFFIGIEAPPHYPWPRSVSDDARGTLAYLFRALVEENASPTQLQGETNQVLSSLTELLLAQLDLFLHQTQKVAPLPHGELIVREAEHLFEESIAQSLSIEDAAARVGVAPSMLRAHFARYRGHSPSVAQMRVRLRQAMALLQNSDLSLREVATTCGFHSPSHLSRHIKALTGQSPGVWRRAA